VVPDTFATFTCYVQMAVQLQQGHPLSELL